MTIISVHSFRGGSGKSNTVANLAVLIAQRGQRVGVVDTDIQSPGIHVLFGLRAEDISASLNDYLWGRTEITECARQVFEGESGGAVFLVPASMKANEIVQVLRQGYDIRRLPEAFSELAQALKLDVIFIDTHPGLNEEALLVLAVSSTVVIVLRPDEQDYEGTATAVEVARSLEVPRIMLILNQAPASLDAAGARVSLQKTFNCEVAAILYHSDRMMELASREVFARKYPSDPITLALEAVVDELMKANPAHVPEPGVGNG
ncbi:MAG: MinD/ParA family protein [Anaerolineaceae bacterium]